MFKLVFLSIFSVGLAAHTFRFDVHYKSIGQEVLVLLLMLIVVGVGVTRNMMQNAHILETNPESQWKVDPTLILPKMPENFQTNTSPWYPLTQKFQIVESCEGLHEETCETLAYRINVQATTGNLRFSDEERTTVKSELNFEGSLEEVNELLAMTQFSPACDSTNPGIENVLISAYASGSMAATQTAVKMKPEGTLLKVVGTKE